MSYGSDYRANQLEKLVNDILEDNQKVYSKIGDILLEIAASSSIVTDLKWVNEHIYWEHGEIDPKLTTGAFGAIIENLVSQVMGIESALSFLDRPHTLDGEGEDPDENKPIESDIYLLSDEKED